MRSRATKGGSMSYNGKWLCDGLRSGVAMRREHQPGERSKVL